jgi:hypothetical protein
MGIRFIIAVALVAAGCRGPAPGDSSPIHLTVDSLVPMVEEAVGLKFTAKPKFAMRTKAEAQRFLESKLEQGFPASKVAGITAAYSLLELLPDTVDLKALLLPLYAEQVVGYYDPDSTTLYAVEGAKSDQLRLVLAHELVHALQHEQLPLETMLKDVSNADRLVASQAVLEGHATIAMMGVVMPDKSVLTNPEFWTMYRDQVKTAQTSMPVFSRAPLILREGLIFPYLAGAEFMRWWASRGQGPLPTRATLPQSSEQILHPERYLAADAPVALAFAESADTAMHEDTMGEIELLVWTTQLRGGGEVLSELPLGWGGDRYRVYSTPAGPALVLQTVWDDSTSARRFSTGPAARFAARARPGYRTEVTAGLVDGRPGVRIVRAPTGWGRWTNLPVVRTVPASAP